MPEFFNEKEYCSRVLVPTFKLMDDKIHNLNIHLTYHCNLNCRYCGYFAPAADPSTLPDKTQLMADIFRIGELTKDKAVEHVFLMGGEPLLNPDVIEYLGVARKAFPVSKIYLYTNGLLVLKQDDLFWNKLKENNIILLLSHYFSDDEFYDKIFKKAEEKEYRYNVAFSTASSNIPLFIDRKLSPVSLRDIDESWNECPFANAAISLVDGNLYSCQTSALLFLLKRKFNTSLKIFEEDGINIYSNNFEDIIKFLKQPKKTCQYCEKLNSDRLCFVCKSEFKKSEWIKDEE